jgi:hypothetical protein
MKAKDWEMLFFLTFGASMQFFIFAVSNKQTNVKLISDKKNLQLAFAKELLRVKKLLTLKATSILFEISKSSMKN